MPPRSPPSTCGASARAAARIGIEPGFLPSDARALLGERLEGARFVDATGVLERLRAIKTPEELGKLRRASELITDSMLATISWAREGTTKAEIIERLRREETGRGLHFDYCLLTLGASHNRAPSAQAWKPGEVLSIDSGGNFEGYIGDLARMGVLGEPDAELEDLLAEVDGVQQAAFAKVGPGRPGATSSPPARRRAPPGRAPASPTSSPTAWGSISHEVPFLVTGRHVRGRRRRPAARGGHGAFGRDHHAASAPRLHQARGHGGGHGGRLRDVRGPGQGLEPGRSPDCRPIGPGASERVPAARPRSSARRSPACAARREGLATSRFRTRTGVRAKWQDRRSR